MGVPLKVERNGVFWHSLPLHPEREGLFLLLTKNPARSFIARDGISSEQADTGLLRGGGAVEIIKYLRIERKGSLFHYRPLLASR